MKYIFKPFVWMLAIIFALLTLPFYMAYKMIK